MAIVGCLSMLQRKRYAVFSAVLLAGCAHEAPPDALNQQIAALRAQVAALTLEVRQPNRAPLDEEGRRQALKAQEQTNQVEVRRTARRSELTRQARTVFEPLFGAWAKGGVASSVTTRSAVQKVCTRGRRATGSSFRPPFKGPRPRGWALTPSRAPSPLAADTRW